MSLHIGTKNLGDRFIIALSGNFDFTAHRDIRKAWEDALKNSERIIEMDLEKVEHLDSAALGMLLLLRERALALDKDVTLSRCQGIALQVLNVANFNRLFNMA